MSLLAWALLGILSIGGREEFHSLWEEVDTDERPTSFEEVEDALKELMDAKHIEQVPGWWLEYRLPQKQPA